MDWMDVARWVAPGVLGAVVLYFIRYRFGRVSKVGVDKLAQFGLHRVPGTGGSGTAFVGTYRDLRCGHNSGSTAHLNVRSSTDVGTVQTGWEFWVELGFDGPPLAIVERNDNGWKHFEGTFVPLAEVPTGDAAFDQRFAVRCQDASWVARVITPDLRAQLLQWPFLFLVQTDRKVYFPLFSDGTRLFDAYGVPVTQRRVLTQRWALMDRTGDFLNAAILLVAEAQVARQIG